MTGAAWEPTEPQSGVDPNMFNLIDPEKIPCPNTGTVSLGWAAVDLFTASSQICEDSEGLESTWQGLQAHYSSPDDERLFAAMRPLATAGDTLAGDLGTVAMALEEFAEAASTAQTALGRLRSEAWDLYDKHKDAYVWWTEVPEDVVVNQRIKSEVNAAWAAFTEAETTCANAIAALCGGPEYVAPDEASQGADEIVYGMPTDLEAAPEPGTFAFFRTGAGDYLDWGLRGEKPWPLDWAGALGRTGWENLGWGAVGDIGVAAASLSGFWSASGGWTLDVRERRTNQDAFVRDAVETVAGYGGLHGENGWIIEPGNGEGFDDWDGQEWRANFDEGMRELGHNYVPYSEWDDDPAYVVVSGTFNVGSMVLGAPLRVLNQIVDASRPGVPTDSSGGRYDVPFSPDGTGPGSGSPDLSGNRDAGASPSERFDGALDDLDLPTDRGPDGPTTPTDPQGPGPSGPAPNGPSGPTPNGPSPEARTHRLRTPVGVAVGGPAPPATAVPAPATTAPATARGTARAEAATTTTTPSPVAIATTPPPRTTAPRPPAPVTRTMAPRPETARPTVPLSAATTTNKTAPDLAKSKDRPIPPPAVAATAVMGTHPISLVTKAAPLNRRIVALLAPIRKG